MITNAEFSGYAVILWDVPTRSDHPVVTTDANEWVVARNTDGETHLVLFFDLKPGVEIRIVIRRADSSTALLPL